MSTQIVRSVVATPSSRTVYCHVRVPEPPRNANASNWLTGGLSEESNILTPLLITVLVPAGSGGVMRATIVSLVPSLTGDGERLSKLTSGNDSSSWACVLPLKTRAARLRQKTRTRKGRAPAARLRTNPLGAVGIDVLLGTAKNVANPRRAVLGPKLKLRRTLFTSQCHTIAHEGSWQKAGRANSSPVVTNTYN